MLFVSETVCAENEYFYKASRLLIDEGHDALSRRMESCIEKNCSFQDFLNRKKHSLYHMWKPKAKCCCCQTDGISSKQRFQIYDITWSKMFEENASQICSGPADCICGYSSKDVSPSQFDISSLSTVLLSQCDLESAKRQDILNLRRLRNDLCHNNTTSLTKDEFERFWSNGEDAVLSIAQCCDEEYCRNLRKRIQKIKSSDIPVTRNVIDEMRNALKQQCEVLYETC